MKPQKPYPAELTALVTSYDELSRLEKEIEKCRKNVSSLCESDFKSLQQTQVEIRNMQDYQSASRITYKCKYLTARETWSTSDDRFDLLYEKNKDDYMITVTNPNGLSKERDIQIKKIENIRPSELLEKATQLVAEYVEVLESNKEKLTDITSQANHQLAKLNAS